MKKTKIVYVKPEMDVMEIAVESMLASSTDNDDMMGSGDPNTGFNSNENRGSWGNLWD